MWPAAGSIGVRAAKLAIAAGTGQTTSIYSNMLNALRMPTPPEGEAWGGGHARHQ